MTVIRKVQTEFSNPNALDAFGRQRVSEPYTQFDSKQISDNLPFFFDDQEVSGSGTSSVYSSLRASTTLGVSNLTAGNRVRQTYQRFNYQSGKSQLIDLTFVLGTGSSGITKRVGYYNDDNGLFIQQQGTTVSFVIRSGVTGSPVDTVINQGSWSNDNFDGTGPSGITLDFTKTQIMFIDFEWLGVGSVRFGFVVDGNLILAHQQNHANGLPVVYMSTPNLPVRYEIDNDGSGPSSDLESICASVMSEGGQQQTGVTTDQDVFAVSRVFSGANTWKPLISYRKKIGYEGVPVVPSTASIQCTTNTNYQFGIFIRPVIAGVDAASRVSIPDSALEYDVSRNNTNNVIGGKKIAGGQVQSSADSIVSALDTVIRLGQAIDGTRDEYVLAVMKDSGANETFKGNVSFIEFL